MDAIPAALGAADRVLADSGYRRAEVSQLAGRVWRCWWRRGRKANVRQHDFRPEPPHPLAKEPQADWIVDAAEDGTAGAPGALPFAQADGGAGVRDREAGRWASGRLLRDLEKVEGEWALVTLAYTCRRLHNLRLA